MKTEGLAERIMTEEEGESPSGSSVGSCLEVVISLFSEAVRLQSRAHLPPSAAEVCRTDCTTKTLLLFLCSTVFSSEFHALWSIQTITSR